MDPFQQELGDKTRKFGSIAEKNFEMHVDRWVGSPVDSMKMDPDLDMVDSRTKIPSLQKGNLNLVPDSIVFDWQIKHSSKQPVLVEKNIGGRKIHCFRAQIKRSIVEKLRAKVRDPNSRLMLAYGVITKTENGKSFIDLDAYEAITWYSLDLKQYFEVVDEDAKSIYIPLNNRLNLRTFALLWASRWVESFYSPLGSIAIREHKALYEIVKKIFTEKSIGDLPEASSLHKKYGKIIPLYLREVDMMAEDKRQISMSLGLGVTLEGICQEITTTSGIDHLATYCPESLYGTTSLWLFARNYWGFMKSSAKVVSRENLADNQRWLPVRSNLEKTPRLLWALLQTVVAQYEGLGVRAMVLAPPDDSNIGADWSSYGGGIGHPPYISLSDDGLEWTKEKTANNDIGEHRDFFHQDNHDIILGHGRCPENAPALKGLPQSQMELPQGIPYLLFSKESSYIRHPSELWKKPTLIL